MWGGVFFAKLSGFTHTSDPARRKAATSAQSAKSGWLTKQPLVSTPNKPPVNLYRVNYKIKSFTLAIKTHCEL